MIATIFIIAVASLAFIAAILIFTPFGFTADFSYTPGGRTGRIALHWLHPHFLRFFFEGGQAFGTLVLLKWTRWIEFPSQARTLLKDIVTESAEENISAGKPAAGEGSTARKDQLGQSDQSDLSDKSDFSDKVELPPQTSKSWLHRWSFVLGKLKKILSILFERRLVRGTIRWLRTVLGLLFRLARMRRFYLKVRAGVGDPAETGKLYGWFVALRGAVAGRGSQIDIRFEPFFDGELFEMEGSIALTTSPARLLAALVIAFVMFPWLPLYGAWRKLKKVRTGSLSAADGAVV